MEIYDYIFILSLLTLIGVFLIKVYNVFQVGKLYGRPITFILFFLGGFAFFLNFVSFMTVHSLYYSIIFRLSVLVFILSILFFIIELIIYFTTENKSIVDNYQSRPINSYSSGFNK